MSTLFEKIQDAQISSKLDSLKEATQRAAAQQVMEGATDPFEGLHQLIAIHQKCSDLIEGHLATMAKPDL